MNNTFLLLYFPEPRGHELEYIEFGLTTDNLSVNGRLIRLKILLKLISREFSKHGMRTAKKNSLFRSWT